jgi:hypothetical protein
MYLAKTGQINTKSVLKIGPLISQQKEKYGMIGELVIPILN